MPAGRRPPAARGPGADHPARPGPRGRRHRRRLQSPDATVGSNNAQPNFRGLGTSFTTRNYFRWYLPSDRFNTDRVEFSLGPNAMLFGDANIGGVANTITKRAIFRELNEVSAGIDSEGGSRFTFDSNRRLGRHVAIRAAGLGSRQHAWQDDFIENRRRSIYLAGTALTLLPDGRADPGIANFPAFPGRKFQVGPGGARLDQDYYAIDVYLTRHVSDDLSIELAGSLQRNNRDHYSGDWNTVAIDVNRVLPGSTAPIPTRATPRTRSASACTGRTAAAGMRTRSPSAATAL